MNSLVKVQDWYEALVEECNAIRVERFYNSNIEAITCYGEIGERIVEDKNYQKFGKGNGEFNKRLFKDIGIGESVGYYCIQFYQKILQEHLETGKYQDVSTAVETIYPKNITWTKIRALLPNKKEIEPPTTEQIAKYQQQIIQGDCLIELPKIPDKSIDMIYIDPPYNVDKAEWDTYGDEEFKIFTLNYLKEAFRVLKDRAHFYIHFPANKACWLENLIKNSFGLEPSSRLIWHYRNLVMGRDAKGKYLNTYQPILHYCIGGKELNFDTEWNDERFDVATIATPQTNFKEGKEHIAQKPLELLEWIIRTGSNTGEKVLDFFAGSGTTGVASAKLGRDFILIEREKEYLDIIYKRLNELG